MVQERHRAIALILGNGTGATFEREDDFGGRAGLRDGSGAHQLPAFVSEIIHVRIVKATEGPGVGGFGFEGFNVQVLPGGLFGRFYSRSAAAQQGGGEDD
jgi:hypothetical protein